MIGNASQRLSAQPFPIFLPQGDYAPSQAYSAIVFDLVAGILMRAGSKARRPVKPHGPCREGRDGTHHTDAQSTSADEGQMHCRRDREGSTATLASTNSSRKAQAGSQFAIVGGSTTPISFSDRFRILAGAQSASCLVGISRHESFYSRSRKA
jgi:hypothetical protein